MGGHEVLKRDDTSVRRVGIVLLLDVAPHRPGVNRYHVPQSMGPVEQRPRILVIVCALKRNNFQPVGIMGKIGVLFEILSPQIRVVDDDDVRALAPWLTQSIQASTVAVSMCKAKISPIELKHSVVHEEMVRRTNHSLRAHQRIQQSCPLASPC